jgi:putative FmdB family regulatory protein
MPIYEYECLQCGSVEEALQKFSDKPLAKCRQCSGKLRKLISNTTFHLKGSGWYVTDYASKSASPSKSTDKGKQAKTSDSPSASGDSKPSKSSD